MPTIGRRWRNAATGLLACTALVWLAAGVTPGQARRGDEPRAEKGTRGEKGSPALIPFYAGAHVGCGLTGCHGSPPIKDEENPLVCRCIEYPIWQKQDWHARAYDALTGERGRRMAKNLGYDVTTKDECLACHAAVVKDEKARGKGFTLSDGVSCSVCHGPYRNWIAPHGVFAVAEEWRDKSRKEKEEMFGMTDLADPVRRAGLCTSCHIGDLESKPVKFVTHDMYAAGHPPLPGFEVASFSRQMRHWQYLREKPPEVRKLLRYNGKDQEQTALVLVGAAVALRDSMRLLARQASDCEKARADRDSNPDRHVLDLASFDCYSCHHDLKTPSWRQKRGFSLKGRLPLPAWPGALVPLAVRHAAGSDAEARREGEEYDRLRKEVERGFASRPLGDTRRIAPAAQAVARWAEDLAGRLKKKPCDQAAARALLALLPALSRDRAPDYDSARQVAWAFQAIHEEYVQTGGKADPEVDRVLKALDREVRLTLPRREKTTSLVADLGEGLQTISNYEPDPFRRTLRQLSERLGEK